MLAEEVSLSPSQLYRKLIALTNISTVQIIQNYRLDKAMQLIKQEAGNISEIAHKTGFKSPAYFTKCFKSKFGKIPTEYMT